MTSTQDRRTIRTVKMIKEALFGLMEEKSFSDISVIDITTRAEINRGTFYLHFIDKFDMLEKIENEIFTELQNSVGKIVSDLYFSGSPNEPNSYMVKLYKYFKDNSKSIKAILGPNGDPSFQIKLKKFIESNLIHIVSDFNSEAILVPKEYFISYIISAHFGVITQWLESDAENSPEEIASILLKIFRLGPYKTSCNALGPVKEDR